MSDGDSTATLNNVRVFLASPGGVEDERASVRWIAGEFSVPLRRFGWQVEILGWEDRGPASGRAQADINADVERCDVFIGIVWDRWGTPTGQHTSGFAEEWDLALARWQADGKPELWLCFKDIDADRLKAPDEQLQEVLAFKDRIQREEIVFYKQFRSPVDLEVSIRRELLAYLLKRTGLSRQAVGHVAVDWQAALAHEPIALLRDGAERERLAGELVDTEPQRAAGMFVELAADVEHLGFANVGENLRDRAASALDRAGRHDEALVIWRRLLTAAVESGHPLDVMSAARRLRTRLPPERDWEASAWMACVDWPDRPDDAVRHLREALAVTPATDANSVIVRRLWRRIMWDVSLASGAAEDVVDDAQAVTEHAPKDFDDDLNLLRAEALSATGHADAEAAWQVLRSQALELANGDPRRAARISARWGVHLAHAGDLTGAEEAFVRAATLWGRMPGYEEEAAACFFSAQTAGSLAGEWVPRGWSWRPLAARLRGSAATLSARARTREQAGVAAHVDREWNDARRHLSLALALHRAGGHLGAIRRVTRMLGDVERDAGRPNEAALRYCQAGDAKAAKDAAGNAASRELTERLPIGQAGWQAHASCAVLGVVGRWATEQRAGELLRRVLDLTAEQPEAVRHRRADATEALSQLAIAVGDEDAPLAMSRLVELVHSYDFALEGAAARGLQMLVEVGRLDASDWLVSRFAQSRWGNEVSAHWVAERLTTPPRIAIVRQAALAGNARAMHALGLADLVSGDSAVEEVCTRYVEAHASSNLGYTADGRSVHGLIALDLIGDVAAHCPATELRRSFAEKLLIYASETRWPMLNRVKAVAGLAALAKTLDPDAYLQALRPLADPDIDHDEEARARPLGDAWVSAGQLEATALVVAAELTAQDNPPDWLRDAVARARIDERDTVRAGAWAATYSAAQLPIDGVELAMIDADVDVRQAALRSWRKRGGALFPSPLIARLIRDPFTRIRTQVIELLAAETHDAATEYIKRLRCDDDAYVRRLAEFRLRQP